MNGQDDMNEPSKKGIEGPSYSAPSGNEPTFSEVQGFGGSHISVANKGTAQIRLEMSNPTEGALAWPPRPEDLKKLYVDERLSAARIAQRYHLRYASPRTAESTILYHLKRAGIGRRDRAEHIRKVTRAWSTSGSAAMKLESR